MDLLLVWSPSRMPDGRHMRARKIERDMATGRIFFWPPSVKISAAATFGFSEKKGEFMEGCSSLVVFSEACSDMRDVNSCLVEYRLSRPELN